MKRNRLPWLALAAGFAAAGGYLGTWLNTLTRWHQPHNTVQAAGAATIGAITGIGVATLMFVLVEQIIRTNVHVENALAMPRHRHPEELRLVEIVAAARMNTRLDERDELATARDAGVLVEDGAQ